MTKKMYKHYLSSVSEKRNTRKGNGVCFAFSGAEALVYLHQHVHEIVLILSDINMPGMGGLELLQRIKQKHYTPSTNGNDDNGL